MRNFDVDLYLENHMEFIIETAKTEYRPQDIHISSQQVVVKTNLFSDKTKKINVQKDTIISAYEISMVDVMLMKRSSEKMPYKAWDRIIFSEPMCIEELKKYLILDLGTNYDSVIEGNRYTTKNSERTLEWTLTICDRYILYVNELEKYMIVSRRVIKD